MTYYFSLDQYIKKTGSNQLQWYVNDVYIAEYHFTIHKEGHSAFYEYVKENVTASMSLGIWDTEKIVWLAIMWILAI